MCCLNRETMNHTAAAAVDAAWPSSQNSQMDGKRTWQQSQWRCFIRPLHDAILFLSKVEVTLFPLKVFLNKSSDFLQLLRMSILLMPVP